jgi:hypothetical protein
VTAQNAATPRDSTEPPVSGHVVRILEVDLRIVGDDDGLAREFVSVFGGDPPGEASGRACLSAVVHTSVEEGWGELTVTGDDLQDPASFLLGFSSPTIPLRLLDRADGGARIAIGDHDEPLFHFRTDATRFRKVPRWRRIVSHFLFLRMLRLRPDLLFFHAASVGIGDHGILLMGPKGTGKSTLSTGIAARGHAFLGDETAAYQSSTGLLLPFRRPVGIKPGPRAAALARSLEALRPAADEDGLIRVPIESLIAVPPGAALPLRAVVFLQGFAAAPKLSRIEPGREEVAQMQPLASSLVDGATPRVFEMIRLLGRTACYRLTAGAPDETVALLEEGLERS